MLGVFHGPRLRDLDAPPRRVDHRRPDRARAGRGSPWPAELLADVASISTDDFDLTTRRATSTRASTWSRSRCGRESVEAPRVGAARGPGMFTLVPAHAPAVARPPRPLAGRRGVALPVVGDVLPAADAAAAHARRRGSLAPRHARHDAGGHRATRRPLLPVRHAPLAGQLAAAALARPPPHHVAQEAGITAPEAMRASGSRTRGRSAGTRASRRWRHGGSPLLRGLIDAGTIELLGGPLSHPFQPLLNPRLREFALREGLADASAAVRAHPGGIWAPECAYAPGMEIDYAAAGVSHFMVDGPSLHGDTRAGAAGHRRPASSRSDAICR